MSAISRPQPPTVRYEADNARKLEALEQFIELGQGSFYLALVQFDLPSLQDEVLSKLREKFADLNLVMAHLTPPPPDAPRAYNVLDQLRELVKSKSPDTPPDTLIITGYESLFPEAIKADDGRITDELVRAIQPLNLGRNLFAEAFPCPVLLCLPPAAMGVFQRSAPDLVSWKSGFFRFEADTGGVRAELEREAGKPMNWLARLQMRRDKPEKLSDETKRIAAFIADAEAMPPESLPDADRLIARLYNRLGWAAIACKDRLQARRAFAEMLERATAAGDRRLISAAERGQRAAEAVASAPRLSPEQTEAARKVFIGAATLDENSGLYGREEELRELISRATNVATRFLTVWGETGSGKSSLVLAGLLPELKRQGHYLPVIVRQWDEPEAQRYGTGSGSDLVGSQRATLGNAEPLIVLNRIRSALEQASGLSLDSFSTLRECIAHVAQETQKTVIVVCDQFEQFFTAHPQRSARRPLIRAVSACLNDYGIKCKFIFILREDQLGKMAEFESEVPDALDRHRRFYLPLFGATDAVRVLRQQADKAAMDWPEPFIRAVVADLTHEDRVRPIELQLVGAALAASDIGNKTDFDREGRAEGLMVEYLRLTLASLHTSPSLVRKMKQILLALVGEPAMRLTLMPEKIASRASISLDQVRSLLDLLLAVHLVRRVDESHSAVSTNKSQLRYELTHDVLAELVLILTRDLQDKRRRAARVLTRAKEDVKINPHYTLGLRDWNLVRNHAGASALADPKVKALLRRSLIRGTFIWLVLLPASLAITTLVVIEAGSNYVTVQHDFKDRLIIRRGLPGLHFLPIVGNEVLVDTGFSQDDFTHEKLSEIQVIANRGWGFNQDNILGRPDFINRINSISKQGLLLIQIGQVADGMFRLLDALNDRNGNVRANVISSLSQSAQVIPRQARPLLLLMLNDSDGQVRSIAALALVPLFQDDQMLTDQALLPLLHALKDDSQSVRGAAVRALESLAQANPKLTPEIFMPLLDVLSDSSSEVFNAATVATKRIAQADPKAALTPLINLSKHINISNDSSGSIRAAVVTAIGEAASANPKATRKILGELLKQSNDSSDPQGRVRRAITDTEIMRASTTNPIADLDKLIELLKQVKYKLDISGSDRSSIAAVIAAVAPTSQKAAQKKALNALIELLKQTNEYNDPFGSVRGTAISAIVEVASVDPNAALASIFELLRQTSSNKDYYFVRIAAADAIAKLAPAETKVLNTLIEILWQTSFDNDHDGDVRSAVAADIGKVASVDPKAATSSLVELLRQTNSDNDLFGNVRRATASAIGQAAHFDLDARNRAVELLASYDSHIRDVIQEPLAELMFKQAAEEMKSGRDPLWFLFDHLEGKRSWLKGVSLNGDTKGNANTYAVYRTVVVKAMARFLDAQGAEFKPHQERLRQRLADMRDKDRRLHLRIAAWNVFVEAAELRDKRQRGEE